MKEIFFANHSSIKILEPKDYKRGKRLTDKEYKTMLEIEITKAEENANRILKLIEENSRRFTNEKERQI